jgi:uncharacterized protein YndB with AHSA1/START domain
MTRPLIHRPDPRLDLILQRVVDVPKELVWSAWTTPGILKRWFTPAPWKAVECEIDLRPGGIFSTVMQGPDGQRIANAGCYLEIVANQKLVWTSALGPGYRPRPTAGPAADTFLMTAVISLESRGQGTKYTALAIHGDEEARKNHEQMGFHAGWGKALDQLVEVVKSR